MARQISSLGLTITPKGVKSHKFAKVTACGGTIGKDWIATEGKHTVTAWIDNYAGRYAGEV